MPKTLYAAIMIVFACLLGTQVAMAECVFRSRLEFGYTTDASMVVKKNTECIVAMEFDYTAFYGVNVRQAPKNGIVRIYQRGYAYIPRKGFQGTDQFIIDAEGAIVNFEGGTIGPRQKAGMAIKITVQ
jgi:hypothetical protein